MNRLLGSLKGRQLFDVDDHRVRRSDCQLDRHYREQNKPPVWFLPLNEPISPHLDELLGPVPAP